MGYRRSGSASARLATPVTMKAEQLAAVAQGYSPRERSWNHLEPWGGGKWHMEIFRAANLEPEDWNGEM